MKLILLCAGFATRLEPISFSTPKHLLRIGGETVLDRFLKSMNMDFEQKVVITNAKYYQQFKNWSADKGTEVYSDGVESKENRLGAVGDLLYIIDRLKINDDILICAPDHIYNFDFSKLFGDTSSCAVAIENDENKFKSGSCLEIKNGWITKFEEKPLKPFSNLYGLPYYFVKKSDIGFLRNIPVIERDNSGKIAEYLVQNTKVRGVVFSGESVHITSEKDLSISRAKAVVS